ncbi:uncharacterized protein K452DRAFT_324653 [Aplosporella prunicola CBS 121167]|uniref:DUF7603 domain-containing protein n=1 Tax=Aplosporella prunicola CBS 121167 TaxID=1176127 RepID=A0A6A6BNT8_9PEZI|nr:uncharacterized protein K452DRAFT_324653 [Aplosporella prunicola CBS 121167]KAF2145790.1 hypothetical protein K452DRAFT_324653 [Aplosporella prunicola CBS 121167]
MHSGRASPQSRQGSLASDKPLSDIQPLRNSRASLANVQVPSFASFRAQTPSIPSSSPVRRKPLPPTASPVASRFSSASYIVKPKLPERDLGQRAFSVDSTPLGNTPLSEKIPSLPLATTQEEFVPRTLHEYSDGHAPAIPQSSPLDPLDDYIDGDDDTARRQSSQYGDTLDAAPARPQLDRSATSYHTARNSGDETGAEPDSHWPQNHTRTPTMSSYASNRPPDLTVQVHGEDGVTGDHFNYDQITTPEEAPREPPKSPGKFSSLFGWRSSSSQNLGPESPTTTFSEKSMSPRASPAMKAAAPSGLNVSAANADAQHSYFTVPGTPLFSSSQSVNAHVEELERELREISAELAGSIRREMELEDELERLQSDHPLSVSDGNRRTSDYYSDSGASSARFPIGDSEQKIEQLEKLRRKAEQEKAQVKGEMAERLQDELRRRTDLEAQVFGLEEQLQEHQNGNADNASLEDVRRRLAEEQQSRENFQDLFAAVRQEHDQDRQERDYLRDQVLPDLRARLEGLEKGSANQIEHVQELSEENSRLRRALDTSRNDANLAEISQLQPILEENAKLQQEIQSLRNENQTLANARRTELEMKRQSNQFNSIAEESDDSGAPATPKIGLSRSNSLARNSVQMLRRGSKASLTRSNSVKDLRAESPRELGDRLKDLEEQRSALHQALKNLLIRQDMQLKQHEKRVHLLETERDRALNINPRRNAFHTEISNLRDEINHLRRRADDALDQKWVAEKNLGGIRMDLGRAEQETTSLRDLLQERDIFVQERRSSAASSAYEDEPAGPVVSLDKAFKELQTTHALSLARVKDMEAEQGETSAEAERVMELLKQSISEAEAERDHAQHEAEQYRQQAHALQQSEGHLASEETLAAQLFAAATRMDELAAQVQQQLHSNTALRQRLAEAIERGEREQRLSATRIMEMQSKLRKAEERVTAAQQHSESTIAVHEEELRDLQEGQNAQLQRMKAGALLDVRSVRMGPSSPLSPMFTHRSPKIDKTTSGLGISMAQATNTENLEVGVEQLERALSEADREMEEVVGRMNRAQLEVADLQAERDDAMRETRRLQTEIMAEREQVRSLMA